MADSMDSECVFEVEHTYTGEVGLHERQRTCKKNPRHDNFHPISSFTEHSLPEVYQTKEIMNAIKIIADLTVRIRVPYTSMSRPTTFPETDKVFTSAELRGCSLMTVGTGFIRSVRIVKEPYKSHDHRACPCYTCRRSKNIPHSEWGEVSIITAAHVLCTADELVHAEVDCFYDDDDNKDTSVKILYGSSMRASKNPITKVSFHDDFCQFSVITHDIDLCEKLSKHGVYDLVTMDLGFEASTDTSLTVIVSHPHGCPKCISWGDCMSYDTLEPPDTPVKQRYRYNTSTCPGSSGALVWLLEASQNKWQKVYVHSASLRNGLNISGTVEIFGEFISSDVPCHIS